jgi:hypothetical protein
MRNRMMPVSNIMTITAAAWPVVTLGAHAARAQETKIVKTNAYIDARRRQVQVVAFAPLS